MQLLPPSIVLSLAALLLGIVLPPVATAEGTSEKPNVLFIAIDVRVPLIIRVPGARANGKTTDALVELVDVYPTLCDLAGLPIPEALEGQSMGPLLENPSGSIKSAAFSQFPRRHKGEHFMGYTMRTENHRYVEWRSQETGKIAATELYDHRRDPQENKNVATNPTNQKLLLELGAQLREGLGQPALPASPTPAKPKPGTSSSAVDKEPDIINVDGTGFHQITEGTHTDFNQTWTRDGKNTPVWNRRNPATGGYQVMAGKIGGKPGEEIALTPKNFNTWAFTCLKDGRFLVVSNPPKQQRGYYLMTLNSDGAPKYERILCPLDKDGVLARISLSVDEINPRSMFGTAAPWLSLEFVWKCAVVTTCRVRLNSVRRKNLGTILSGAGIMREH